jgi:hypothetical protein
MRASSGRQGGPDPCLIRESEQSLKKHQGFRSALELDLDSRLRHRSDTTKTPEVRRLLRSESLARIALPANRNPCCAWLTGNPEVSIRKNNESIADQPETIPPLSVRWLSDFHHAGGQLRLPPAYGLL